MQPFVTEPHADLCFCFFLTSIFASIAKHWGKRLNKLLDWNTDCASKVVIRLKINGSAMDNHSISPRSLLSCAFTEFFKTSLRHVVCVREDLNMLTNAQIFKHPHNLILYIQNTCQYMEVKCPIWRKHCLSESSLHSNLFCPAVSPRQLHYSPPCCRCLASLFTNPHFVLIIHMVWLFDMRENWQITGWRAVTSQIHAVTGAHEKLGVWAVLMLGGLGRAKTTLALLVVD